MTSFSVSRAARTDLKNIAAYTQKNWGAEQRRTYLKGLDLTFHFLVENPQAGSPCDYIAVGLRKRRFESHTIFTKYRAIKFSSCVFSTTVWMWEATYKKVTLI